MPVPASPSQHPPAGAPRTSFAARAAVLVVTAAAGGAALALAPSGATSWTLAVVLAGWACVAVTVLVDHRLVRKARSTAAERESETSRLRAESARRSAEISHLAGATLPAVAERLREGTSAADVLAAVPPPSDPQLSRVTHAFAVTVEEDVRRVMTLEDEYRAIRDELEQAATEHDRFVRETMLAAISRSARAAPPTPCSPRPSCRTTPPCAVRPNRSSVNSPAASGAPPPPRPPPPRR